MRLSQFEINNLKQYITWNIDRVIDNSDSYDVQDMTFYIDSLAQNMQILSGYTGTRKGASGKNYKIKVVNNKLIIEADGYVSASYSNAILNNELYDFTVEESIDYLLQLKKDVEDGKFYDAGIAENAFLVEQRTRFNLLLNSVKYSLEHKIPSEMRNGERDKLQQIVYILEENEEILKEFKSMDLEITAVTPRHKLYKLYNS